MNPSNLKSVLAIVCNNIAMKAAVEGEARHKLYEESHAANNKKYEQALADAYTSVKNAPVDKSLEIKWSDTISPHYNLPRWDTALSKWAKKTINDVLAGKETEGRKIGELVATTTLRFTYGTGKDDYVHIQVSKSRLNAYTKLRDDYDAMRVTLLMSDDNSAAAAIRMFQVKIGKL